MGEDLRFRSLRLLNWMNFARVDVAIPDRAFLVGPNASGKSNFLDAFRFLRGLASSGGGLQESIRLRHGMRAIRCLAARRNTDVEVHVVLENKAGGPPWEYQLAINQDKRRGAFVRKERVVVEGKEVLSRPRPQDNSDPAQLTQTYLEQVNVNREFRDLAAFFTSIRYLHIVPQLVRDPERSKGVANDPFGGDFLQQVAKTKENVRAARLRRIEDVLRVAVPQLQGIELWWDQDRAAHLRGRYEHWRPKGAWQTEEQFSDGTLRLMGLLWAAMEGDGPLLLEEPELSLHSEIVRHLPQMFARLQRRAGRQIFVSTHSPDLLRDEGIGLDEVLLLIPGREGTEVRTAGSYEDVKDLLEGGLPLPEVVIPKTQPKQASQLSLFGEA